MSTRLLTLLALTAAFAARPAHADCGFQVTIENIGDLPFTVTKIKTNVASGPWNTNWTGVQKIGSGNEHTFKFEVTSACGKEHGVKLFMQDGEECYLPMIDSGETRRITKKDYCE